MKKGIALSLAAFLLLLLLGGCGPVAQPGESSGEASQPAGYTLQVGFGRVDISPEGIVPLSGRNDLELSDGTVADPLYGTCIAFTDETDNTVLLFEIDLCAVNQPAIDAKMKISRQTGVNGLQIMMCSTHNHSAPNTQSSANAQIEQYCEDLPGLLVQAAKDALADRKPVTGLFTASAKPEGLNYLRHHILEDGSKTGWAGPARESAVGHLFEPDNELQLIKITREGGKDVVLMNWQAHPSAHAKSAEKLQIRSDVDIIRKELEEKLDCQFAYFLGASGNVNSNSYVKSEIASPDYTGHYVEKCKKLSEYAINALTNSQVHPVGKLQFAKGTASAPPSDGAANVEILHYAFSIGDIAFVTAPYEMFTENGQTIKKESQFAMTFVATCANGAMGYLPSEYAFEYDGYETSITRFAKGTAEMMTQEHISLLKQLYETKD